jgi:hypothetical protein
LIPGAASAAPAFNQGYFFVINHPNSGVIHMAKYKVLTVNNPKVQKGQGHGYLTGILHLAPASLSGFNVCPMATQGCMAACLNTAGRGGIAKGGVLTHEIIAAGERTNAIQAARIRKTQWFFNDRASFMEELAREIMKLRDEARELGLKPAIRLNGTSDIRWERIPVRAAGRVPGGGLWCRNGASLMECFPEVQFYDYTKIANRRDLPSNYRLTFSLAENNDEQAKEALAAGHNVAVVFRDKETRAKYMGWGSWPFGAAVIDGDETDLRFLDPRGAIVGLYAKGNAKRDTSGFVRD